MINSNDLKVRLDFHRAPFYLMQECSGLTEPQKPIQTARTARVLHGALCAGVILFAIVAHFFLVANALPSGNLAEMAPKLLAVSLVACVVAIFLSTRVPRPAGGESADSFWQRAGPPALRAWSFLEGASLLGIVLYSQTASRAAISIAGVALVIFVLMNPGYFERR